MAFSFGFWKPNEKAFQMTNPTFQTKSGSLRPGLLKGKARDLRIGGKFLSLPGFAA
jgi:hypothetical protein